MSFNSATGQMSGTGANTDKLNFNLYEPGTANAVPTAAGTAGYYKGTSANHGTAMNFGLRVVVPQNQNISADTYTGAVTATVNY
jgi:spore coat protein U-like protein